MKDAAVPGRSCSTLSITTGLFRWGGGGGLQGGDQGSEMLPQSRAKAQQSWTRAWDQIRILHPPSLSLKEEKKKTLPRSLIMKKRRIQTPPPSSFHTWSSFSSPRHLSHRLVHLLNLHHFLLFSSIISSRLAAPRRAVAPLTSNLLLFFFCSNQRLLHL